MPLPRARARTHALATAPRAGFAFFSFPVNAVASARSDEQHASSSRRAGTKGSDARRALVASVSPAQYAQRNHQLLPVSPYCEQGCRVSQIAMGRIWKTNDNGLAQQKFTRPKMRLKRLALVAWKGCGAYPRSFRRSTPAPLALGSMIPSRRIHRSTNAHFSGPCLRPLCRSRS
jgi:hypothetical protein